MNKPIHISYILLILGALSFFLHKTPSRFVYADTKNKITICHATNSETNPYNLITVDDDSIFKQGHDQHQDHHDIIPPFDYGDGLHFSGLNWDSLGQSILNNGCNLPSPTSTPAITPTTIPTPTFIVLPSPTFIPTPTLIVTDPTVTMDPTSTPAILSPTPTSTSAADPTIAPATTATPTIVVPTLTPSPTSTPSASNSNQDNNSNNNSNNNNSNNSSPSYSTPVPTPIVHIARYQPKIVVLGTTDNFNPLVDGIRQSYGGIVLGKSTELMATGETIHSTGKLPSGNSLTDQKISIPSINLSQNVYLPQRIGDQLTVGHQEVLLTTVNGSTVYYGHNSSSVFGSIFKLNNGDIIKINHGNLVLTYRVSNKENVSKFDINSIQTDNSTDIVLVTCSQSIFDHRIIIKASLIK